MGTEPLTDDQLGELRQALRTLERELATAEESTREGAAPVDLDEPIGRVSRMDAIAQQSMRQAGRASLKARLQHVRAALRRFAEDEYGLCLGCGEDVGFARLRARPEAPFCIACQSARERAR